ncbi:phosphodiester glycosidase family protein [Falsirhodobacter sp. alg1]|uniref:phosphodiester glycosidase family protein n=1 Tax=Falsirhodobacter sp. alg1 TaxID=1472418 RepID=UPI0005EF30FD|nr:phosphodiester glycosidase family protein [Falsirhodobacter sp. alg1]
MKHRLLAALTAFFMPVAAHASCDMMAFEGRDFAVCEANASDDVRVFQTAPDGRTYGSFTRVDNALKAEGKTLGFAMNAGMYHPDRSPVGLLIEDGQQRARLVTGASDGNFGLLPNGVFCIGDRFSVVETRAYAADPPRCRFATQSGPMLVIDGALHPRFLPDSTSRHIRNGVGVSADGQKAWFVMSSDYVTFDEFGRFFRDGLETPNALYFDGSISRLYSPDLGRSDIGFPLGPIVGLAIPR